MQVPKPLIWLGVGLLALALYFGFFEKRSSYYADNTSPQNAAVAGVRDVRDAGNYRYRDAATQAADLVKQGRFEEAKRIMHDARMEQGQIDQILAEGLPVATTPVVTQQQQSAPDNPAPPPPVQQAPSSPEWVHEPNRDFALLDASSHAYQLDAREEWRELDVVGVANRYIHFVADPSFKVCSAVGYKCGDPDGVYDVLPDTAQYQLFALHNGTARGYALLGRWGSFGVPFVLGVRYDALMPREADGQRLKVMANVETPYTNYRAHNFGGHRIVSILIQ